MPNPHPFDPAVRLPRLELTEDDMMETDCEGMGYDYRNPYRAVRLIQKRYHGTAHVLGPFHFFVHYEEGFFEVEVYNYRCVHVTRLWVRPSRRQQGAATAMLTVMLQACKQYHARLLICPAPYGEMVTMDERAIRLWLQRLDFKPAVAIQSKRRTHLIWVPGVVRNLFDSPENTDRRREEIVFNEGGQKPLPTN